ncbi:SAM-dependent methyltransferases [Brevundimonas diminuta 3F5N]|uniref:SAM-dependent methyltransferases n=2 Tax=Brevundimonas diminuta TaxID=293 RepID=A0A1R4G6U2_BREDI|nr:SAM-dependent methyltransferases [Brevundimonas diminuta 3F5N]
MKTMDSVKSTPDGAQSALISPAAERNSAAILEVLRAHLPVRGRVLEIAAGSGQHAVAFATALPGLEWTPSDPSAEARASIEAWRAKTGAANLRPAQAVDMLDDATWPSAPLDAVVCINMIHISPWSAAEGLMQLAERSLTRPGGLMYLYGPYREAEVPLAPSNAAFDDSLKARDPAWGLRDRGEVEALARSHGLALTLRRAMPANNLSLIFRRV